MESRKLSRPQRWGLTWFTVFGLINLIEGIGFGIAGKWVMATVGAFIAFMCAFLAVSLIANPNGERK